MNDNTLIPGRIVVSNAGRDKGKVFMVIEIVDEDFILIANGRSRSIDKPKLKKLKHLNVRPETADGISEKLVNKKQVFDAEIRKSLVTLGYKV